jgi:hypothetical protein
MRLVLLLGGAALIALGSSGPVSAQGGGVHPECRSMRDQRSCTCALNNGGRVIDDPARPGRKSWRSAKVGTAAHMAFMNCSNGSGR